MKTYRFLLRFNSIFYFITGLWPLIDIVSFMAVTGPKTDIWLVKTVGMLITACSIGMLAASFRKKPQPDVILIVIGFAAFLSFVDIYYVLKDVIWPVYLADAAVEILLILLWVWWYICKRPAEDEGKKET
ncbi:hypothetical protein [Adhaeribacter terreus]|uniref:Uncharacterized protein n=1 Tax=Adhaeribacter terreus TaxID=529703 RepID=A0ABW0EAV6_9BACT